MMNIIQPIKVLLKIDEVCVDNNVFRLHYKLTVVVLIVASLLVTSQQYFGEPIDCVTTGNIHRQTFNTYCWIFSTYTVKKHLTGTPGIDVAHAGVGSHVHQNGGGASNTPDSNDEEVIHQKYYQWVCMVLIFQAALFYIPRVLWKTWEGGRVRMLALDLVTPIVDTDKWNKDRRTRLIEYLSDMNESTHAFYITRFIFCEILNFVNVVGQIFFVDLFLGWEFSGYGPAVVAFLNSPKDGVSDPMARVFPKVAKCIFRDFGPSGTLQEKDAMCILPLNILNEKLYAFLWFWFVALAVLSGLALVYRAVVVCSPRARIWLLAAQTRRVSRRCIQNLVYAGHAGDWFMLQQLGKNMNPEVFRELLLDLSEEAERRSIVV